NVCLGRRWRKGQPAEKDRQVKAMRLPRRVRPSAAWTAPARAKIAHRPGKFQGNHTTAELVLREPPGDLLLAARKRANGLVDTDQESVHLLDLVFLLDPRQPVCLAGSDA